MSNNKDKLKNKRDELANSSKQNKEILLNKSSVLIKANFSIIRYILLAIFIAIILLSGYVYYLIYNIKDPDVYSFNKQSASKLYQLKLPKISNDALIKWTSQAIADIYTFNFDQDLDEHFGRVSSYFTKDGYTAFLSDLEESGLKTDAINKKLVYTANSCDVVNILNQRQVYTEDSSLTVWYLEVPILLQIQSDAPTAIRRFVVKVIVSSGDDVPADKSVGFVGLNMVPAAIGTCSFSTI